ncbi:hypothetical protein KUTeg_023853 [Tegillarca granosa]|uniref:Uncharacterized protein n=1 Tax=Tegillarca granosa TaxID=220873 RepID=A0ABQ9E2X6_TEGGR|nr:hypothetical protein KUTeg_023853 [Tegillarca granosa]
MKNIKEDGMQAAVAKRLFMIVFTDILCWVPIGCMVVMWIFEIDLPRQIYAWISKPKWMKTKYEGFTNDLLSKM